MSLLVTPFRDLDADRCHTEFTLSLSPSSLRHRRGAPALDPKWVTFFLGADGGTLVRDDDELPDTADPVVGTLRNEPIQFPGAQASAQRALLPFSHPPCILTVLASRCAFRSGRYQ